jgi:pimeloyl-ACP methyl ester carboxylesterase
LGKVILVGHSLGSAFAVVEANRYANVHGLILTGLLHTVAPAASVVAPVVFIPAARDPKFAHRHLPPGYLTALRGALPIFLIQPECGPRCHRTPRSRDGYRPGR